MAKKNILHLGGSSFRKYVAINGQSTNGGDGETGGSVVPGDCLHLSDDGKLNLGGLGQNDVTMDVGDCQIAMISHDGADKEAGIGSFGASAGFYAQIKDGDNNDIRQIINDCADNVGIQVTDDINGLGMYTAGDYSDRIIQVPNAYATVAAVKKIGVQMVGFNNFFSRSQDCAINYRNPNTDKMAVVRVDAWYNIDFIDYGDVVPNRVLFIFKDHNNVQQTLEVATCVNPYGACVVPTVTICSWPDSDITYRFEATNENIVFSCGARMELLELIDPPPAP